VAHAYAGALIAASANERIRSLVFITALTPDEGETVADVFYGDKPILRHPSWHQIGTGLSGSPKNDLARPFARTLRKPRRRSWQQRNVPLQSNAFNKKAIAPAWKKKPTWCLVAQEDRTINPATQFFLAQRMSAKIRAERIDHMPLVTAPATPECNERGIS
jgi:pimeloyl-ACP methyl ester carboxylesterase